MIQDIQSQLRWLNPIPKNSEIDACIKTNWCVITGGPASGKSLVIKKLNESGVQTINEIARDYINRWQSKGKSLAEIKADEHNFQRNIINAMYNTEKSLDPTSLIFFDRAIPDGIAFYRCSGIDPKEIILISKINIYNKIFLFDLVPDTFVQKDGVRLEDYHTRKQIEVELEKAYLELGYKVTRVPFMEVNQRAKFVLENA